MYGIFHYESNMVNQRGRSDIFFFCLISQQILRILYTSIIAQKKKNL